MDSGNGVVTRISVILVLLGFWMSINEQLNARGQEQPQTTTSESKTGVRPVNLFIVNDENNPIANSSVTISLKTMREQHPDYLGKIVTVTINGSDPKIDLEILCSAWDTALQEKSSEVPDLVLDTTRTGYGAETVNSFVAALGIPTLTAQFGQEGDLRHWRNLTNDQKDYLIQVMPPADLIPEAIRELAKAMEIGNAAVIFDPDFVMDHKYKSLLLNVQTRHVITSRKNGANLTEALLNKLRSLDIVNYFLLTDDEGLKMTLNAAQKLNYTDRKYGWYAFTQHEFDPWCDCQNLSLLFFKPERTVESQQRLGELDNQRSLKEPKLASAFYYDLTNLAVLAMRRAIVDADWPYEPNYITCDAYDNDNTPVRKLDLLEKLKSVTRGDDFRPTFADFKWGTKNGEHMAKFNMTINMIGIINGKIASTDELGTWPAGINNDLVLPNNNTDVVRSHTAVTSFRIVTVQKPPFMMYDPETQEWSGYCIDLIEEIRKLRNFEYEIYEVQDKKFGTMDENGTWNGMIRELKDKKADIALGALSVMAERENVVDFTVPYYDLVGISILMRKPKAETSLFKFLTVLENEVWLCILGSYFFTSFLMWIFDRWSPYSYQNNREKYRDDDEKREFSLRECLWFCMTSLTPQGGGEAPKNLSGRLVAATWWLFGFIIIASYTANLAAFLTVSRLETPIESLEDLSKQYKVQYAPIINSEGYTYFERMSNIETRFYGIWKDMSLNDSLSEVERAKFAVWDYPVSDKYTKMFQAMKEATFPQNLDEALRRVRQIDQNLTNEFAFVGDATDIKYLAMTNCDLLAVGEEFSRKPYAIAVQQGSALKDQLNNAILQLLNKRTLEQLKNKWWSSNPKKKVCEKQDDQSDGISIQNIGGVFIVIFVGIGLACVTLACEYWWYRHRPNHQKSNGSGNRKLVKVRDGQPVRFTLKPARTPAFESTNQFRSRF